VSIWLEPFFGGKTLFLATATSWLEILLVRISYKQGEWDISVGIVPLLVFFWMGAEIVRVVRNWRRSQHPPHE
jgi:hypothetical protein